MRFQVFKDGRVLQDFHLCGQYMFGSDGAGLRRSRVTMEQGLLHCIKPGADSAGLALLWPVEGFGRIMLPTTCLPERERAYCLNVEVARARLMQITNRREEWSIFDSTQDLEDISREAQDLFVKAIQRIRNPAVASQLADRSLRRAMVLSERITLSHAEALLKARKKAKALGRACLGCRVDLDLVDRPGYVDSLAQVGGFAVVPTPWAQIEPQEGTYEFSRIDRAVQAAASARLILGAGPLLSFGKADVPSWLAEGQVGFERVREAAYRFVTAVASRYGRRVHRWFVLSGLNAYNDLGFTVEQVREITNAATLAVKAANSRSFRIIEVGLPWGEYYATAPNTIAPVAFMDMIVQAGIGFEAFALQLRFGKDQTGLHVRDLMQVASLLDVLSLLGKPLFVTAVEVPSAVGDGAFDVQSAGYWHRPWDQVRQAAWMENLAVVCLGRPFVEAVIFEHLVDRADSVIRNSGLLTGDLEPKDSFRAICRFRDGIG